MFKDDDGEIKFRLNFRKRYITLAPIANLISLAVRLHDPDNLLGKGEDAGVITSGEHKTLSAARDACLAAIEVDVFTHDEFVGKAPHGLTATGDGGT